MGIEQLAIGFSRLLAVSHKMQPLPGGENPVPGFQKPGGDISLQLEPAHLEASTLVNTLRVSRLEHHQLPGTPKPANAIPTNEALSVPSPPPDTPAPALTAAPSTGSVDLSWTLTTGPSAGQSRPLGAAHLHRSLIARVFPTHTCNPGAAVYQECHGYILPLSDPLGSAHNVLEDPAQYLLLFCPPCLFSHHAAPASRTTCDT
ncbi:hypothetical protein CB1_001327002 [Camelus ferus]|nr:hypothetical protein CB1_001327002 [Camelus ferus]